MKTKSQIMPEFDFAICMTSRTKLRGRTISCACCWSLLSHYRTPIAICVDRVADGVRRVICDECAANLTPQLLKCLKLYYGPTFNRITTKPPTTPPDTEFVQVDDGGAMAETVQIEKRPEYQMIEMQTDLNEYQIEESNAANAAGVTQ